MIPTRIGQVCSEYMFVGVMPYKSNAYALFQSKFTYASRSANIPKFSKSPRLPIAPEIKPVVATPSETAVIMYSTMGLKNTRLIDMQTFQIDPHFLSVSTLSWDRHPNYAVSFSLRYNKEWHRPWTVSSIPRYSRLASSTDNTFNNVKVLFCPTNQLVRVNLYTYYRKCVFLPLVRLPLL